jgi:hypothetical protein
MNLWSIQAGRINLLAVLASASGALAQSAPDPLWLRQFTYADLDGVRVSAAGVDGAFLAGYTFGSQMNPQLGLRAALLIRLDEHGEQVWVRQFGSEHEDWADSAALSEQGGIFVGGRTFNAGALSWSNWLAHFNSAGDRLWLQTDWPASFRAMAEDGSGGFYVGGGTQASLGAPNAGGSDIVVARFNRTGSSLWVRQIGSSSDESARAAVPDGQGGVFVGGATAGHLARPVVGLLDAWVARYDSSGNQVWLRQFGDSSADQSIALAGDGAGGVFVTGATGGPSGHTTFLTRFDAAGAQQWFYTLGPTFNQAVRSMASDGTGGVFIAGHTGGQLGGVNMGSDDAWLARYDADGNQLWITQFGTPQADRATVLASDLAGGVYIAGETRGWLGAPNAGGTDIFVARWPGIQAPLGACCLHDGSCEQLTRWRCTVVEGALFHGEGSQCAATPCPQPGACCLPVTCEVISEIQCDQRGGLYRGHGSNCEHAQCPAPPGEHLVLPNAFETVSGNESNAALLFHQPATYQIAYAASEVAIPIGAQITGFTARIGGTFPPGWTPPTSWPPSPANFASYEIRASSSVHPPGSLSTTFEENIGPDAVLAREGPLTIPALSFAGGAMSPSINEWGHIIDFSTPYTYNGEDLLITIRYSGNDTLTYRFFDALNTTHTSYGILTQARFAYSMTAITGNTTSATILRIRYELSQCYANCDESIVEPVLNVEDFICFVGRLAEGLMLPPEQQVGHYANCDGSTAPPVLNVEDFLCFMSEFAAGCG